MLYSQNLQKQTPKVLKNRGARARRAGPGSAFALIWDSEEVSVQIFSLDKSRRD